MTRFLRPLMVTLGVLAVAAICLPAQGARQPGGRRGPGGGRAFGGPGGPGGFNLRFNTLMLANAPAVQEKLGIEDKKAALEELGTKSREAIQERFGKMRDTIRDMTPEERTKFFEKMREAGEKALKETDGKVKGLLGEAKFNQLVEIRAGLMLKQAGPTAVLDPSVAALLKLTDEQKQKIKEVVDKYREESRKLLEGFRRGPRPAAAGGPNVRSQVIFVAAPGGGAGRPDFSQIREKMNALRKTANRAIGKILNEDQKAKIKELMAGVEGIKIPRRGFGGGMRGGPGGRPGGRGRPDGGGRPSGDGRPE